MAGCCKGVCVCVCGQVDCTLVKHTRETVHSDVANISRVEVHKIIGFSELCNRILGVECRTYKHVLNDLRGLIWKNSLKLILIL